MPTVLFPDPFIMPQVAAARTLGRRGDDCQVAWCYDGWKRFFKSRYVSRVHCTTNREENCAQFVSDIVEVCNSSRIDVVLPVSIDSTEALLPVIDELSRHVATLLPTPAQLLAGTNKVRTLEVCKQFDVLTPKTRIIRSAEDLETALTEFQFPVILKHSRNFGSARGVRFVGNPEESRAALRSLEALHPGETELLLQEHVPGQLYDATTVAKSGKSVGVFIAVRKLMYPISGGVTCVAVSVRNPELERECRRLLEALRWNGPVEVEFKLDSRDGKFKLIEINPRFWASLATSAACGIDFAGSAVDLAMGKETKRFPDYPSGLRFMYPIARLPLAYWQMARACGINAIRDPQSYLRTRYNIDLSDPLPDVFETLVFLRRFIARQYSGRMTFGARQMIERLDHDVPLGGS